MRTNVKTMFVVFFDSKCVIRRIVNTVQYVNVPERLRRRGISMRKHCYSVSVSRQCSRTHDIACPWILDKTQRNSATATILQSGLSSGRSSLFSPRSRPHSEDSVLTVLRLSKSSNGFFKRGSRLELEGGISNVEESVEKCLDANAREYF